MLKDVDKAILYFLTISTPIIFFFFFETIGNKKDVSGILMEGGGVIHHLPELWEHYFLKYL